MKRNMYDAEVIWDEINEMRESVRSMQPVPKYDFFLQCSFVKLKDELEYVVADLHALKRKLMKVDSDIHDENQVKMPFYDEVAEGGKS